MPGPAHRLDDLGRADAVGHRPGHVGVAQAVIGAEAGVAERLQRNRWGIGRTCCNILFAGHSATVLFLQYRGRDSRPRAAAKFGSSKVGTASLFRHWVVRPWLHGKTGRPGLLPMEADIILT